MKAELKAVLNDTLAAAGKTAANAVTDIAHEGARQADDFIKNRVGKMADMVHATARKSHEDNFVGIDESAILRFVPDRRSLSGIGPFCLAIFLLFALSGAWKVLAIIPLFAALAVFGIGYVWQSKVQIDEGYDGVICEKGQPVAGAKPDMGRNWKFGFFQWIPFVVATKQNQVVQIEVANFTRDFAAVSLTFQIAFRISDPALFAVTTTPATAMRLMEIYARYTALRMITSMVDARAKFSGRDNLENVAAELNRHLGGYGIHVIRVAMPNAENGILQDLENIRISVVETEAMRKTKTVRLEAGVKAVEGQMRAERKSALALSQQLQNEVIGFVSAVAVASNAYMQDAMIGAQQMLTERLAKLNGDTADLVAKIEKARALEGSIPALISVFAIRLAKLKTSIALKMLPKEITVLSVDGIGTGAGMSIGNELFQRALGSSSERQTFDAIPVAETTDVSRAARTS